MKSKVRIIQVGISLKHFTLASCLKNMILNNLFSAEKFNFSEMRAQTVLEVEVPAGLWTSRFLADSDQERTII